MDADSELLCPVDVLPANADEAANATQLIATEEHAHGNDVESLSSIASAIAGMYWPR